MAEIPTLEPAPDAAASDASGQAPQKRSRLALWLVIAVVLLAAAAAGGWFVLGHARAKAKARPAAARPSGPPIYISLDPPFVTNFQADQAVRFLELSVEVMTHDPATEAVIKANNPVVRNNLLLLFSNQKYTDIATRQGKERLQAQALASVRQVVAANGGDPTKVDAVYFTSFVMQ